MGRQRRRKMAASNRSDFWSSTHTQLIAEVVTALLSRNLEAPHRSENNHSPAADWNRLFSPEQSNMKSEERRLATFQYWPASAPVSPFELAVAGFYFIGPKDSVKCFCCGGVLHNWLVEDVPMLEHAKFFPSCTFIQGWDERNQSVPLSEETQRHVSWQFLGPLRSLSVDEATVSGQGENPAMESESERRETFDNWPSLAPVSPEVLAEAGFFYTGVDDYVRCFSCDGALRNWNRGDDPWVEHARWFPRCRFLRQSRGRDFVNCISDGCRPVSSEGSLNSSKQQPESIQDSVLTAEERLRQLQEERMCKVCLDNDVSILLVPCGHLVVCAQCAPNLSCCPICRGTIRETMKAFLS